MPDPVPSEESGDGTVNATAAASERAYLFRADDYYCGGPVGLALGDEADAADIQDFAEHVLRKESRRTSRYTSFSDEIQVARRFTSAPDARAMRKVEVAALRGLQAAEILNVWGADDVYLMLRAGPRKLSRQAADVRAAMRRSREVLIEGQIPEIVLAPVN